MDRQSSDRQAVTITRDHLEPSADEEHWSEAARLRLASLRYMYGHLEDEHIVLLDRMHDHMHELEQLLTTASQETSRLLNRERILKWRIQAMSRAMTAAVNAAVSEGEP